MSESPASPDSKPPRVGLVSLGCPKALVDAEQIITGLRAEGYDIAPDYASADMVIVNTCGFIDAAREESLAAIGEALNENGKVIVTGCLGARSGLIEERYPKVIAVTGPHAKTDVLKQVRTHLPAPHHPYHDLLPPAGLKLTPRHYAYLKISEGCNHRCSFCIIPSLRGDLVSRPVDEVLREAEHLAAEGVNELLIVSQDTSAYGVDRRHAGSDWHGEPYRAHIVDLARGLGQLGIWVRLHYVYPYPHVDNIIPLMAQGAILPYLDIPFQHADRGVLSAMRRPASAENVLRRLEAWRRQVPELCLRSTFIVGFPGETEQAFEALLTFLRDAQLDRVGAFAYSPVDGAAANRLPGALPESVKQERLAALMAVQSDISARKLRARIGEELTILVDEVDEATGTVIGRSYADAPQIDGVVRATGGAGIAVGEFVDVEIHGADAHDLSGDILSL